MEVPSEEQTRAMHPPIEKVVIGSEIIEIVNMVGPGLSKTIRNLRETYEIPQESPDQSPIAA